MHTAKHTERKTLCKAERRLRVKVLKTRLLFPRACMQEAVEETRDTYIPSSGASVSIIICMTPLSSGVQQTESQALSNGSNHIATTQCGWEIQQQQKLLGFWGLIAGSSHAPLQFPTWTQVGNTVLTPPALPHHSGNPEPVSTSYLLSYLWVSLRNVLHFPQIPSWCNIYLHIFLIKVWQYWS